MEGIQECVIVVNGKEYPVNVERALAKIKNFSAYATAKRKAEVECNRLIEECHLSPAVASRFFENYMRAWETNYRLT